MKIIEHDRQTQFEKSLAFMHELYANADPTPIEWPGMPKYSLQRANGSRFVPVIASDHRAGCRPDLWWLVFGIVAASAMQPGARRLERAFLGR